MSGKKRWLPTFARFARWSRLACGLLLAGCTSDSYRTAGNDPLFGGLFQTQPADASAQSSTASTAASGTVPEIPRSSSSPSTAALAGGSGYHSLDSGRELRIEGPPWQEEPSNVVLAGPQAADEASRGVGGAPPSNVALAGMRRAPQANPVGATSLLLSDLATRGVVWWRLETWGDRGEYKFSCAVPNRQNPRLRRAYEGRAHDPEAAIRAVLAQIEQGR